MTVLPAWPTGLLPFLFWGLCLRRLCLVLPSSPWLVFHGVCFPTAPAAPSLRPLVPSGSLTGRQLVQVYHILLFCSVQAKDSRLVNARTSMALKLLLVVCSFVSEGDDPSQRPDAHFLLYNGSPAILFAISSPRVSHKVVLRFPMLSSHSCCLLPHLLMSLLVAIFLRRSCSLSSWSLIPLLPSWHVRCLSRPSFRGSSQHCPHLVPDDCVPYALQEWHCGSSLRRWRQTSSGTHHCPGSVSSAPFS
jgi:hypothetical protein